MADYSITAIVGAVTEKFEKALDKAKTKAKNFGTSTKKALGGVSDGVRGGVKSLSKFGDTWQKAMAHPAVQACAIAGKAVVDFGMDAVKTAGKIDASMNEVFTLLPGITEDAKKKMTKEMMALSNEMGKMPEDMIGSLYNALSAGVPKDNVFDFLKNASKASIAGVSTVDEAVGALTTVLNGYKLPATEAGQISDTLFTTIKNGVTTMPELAKNIGKVTPIAASLGVKFDEVGAAFAEMTKNLGPRKTAEAGTMLKMMFSELSKAGSQASEQFEAVSGKTFPEFVKAGGTTLEALKLMSAAAEKTGGRVSDMFGSIEAGQAALILSANNGKNFAKELGNMAKKAGATDEAYKTVDRGFSRFMEKLMSGLESLKYTVGTALSPLVDAIMPLFLKGLKMVQKLPWDQLGKVLGENAKALEPIIDAVFQLVKELFPLIGPILKIAILQLKMSMPLLVLGVKILTKLMPIITWLLEKVAWGADLLGKVFDWITKLIVKMFDWGNTAQESVDGVEKKGKGFWDTVKGWFTQLWEWFKVFWSWCEKIAGWLMDIGDSVKTKGSLIAGIWNWLGGVITDWFKNIGKRFRKMISDAWQGWKDFVMGIVQKFLDFRQKLIDGIKNMAMSVIKKIIAIREKIFEWFPWLGKLVKWWENKVKTFFTWLWGIVQPYVERVKNFLLEQRSKLIDKFIAGAKKVFSFVKPVIETLWSLVKTAIKGVGVGLKVLGGIASGVFSGMKAAAGIAGKAVSGVSKAAGWLGKKLGIVKKETKAVNEELEKTDAAQKAVATSAEEMAEAKSGLAEQEAKITAEQEKQKQLAEEQAKQQEAWASMQEMIASGQKKISTEQAAQKLTAEQMMKIGAEKIVQSKIHTGQLTAAVKKHKDINSLAEMYELIATGKKTPEQIINEAFGAQVALNNEGKKYRLADSKGKTPSQQLKIAKGDQKKLNDEASKNPLLQMKKGELKVSCDSPDYQKHLNIIIQQIALVHRDLLKIDRTLGGKFVNQ